MTENASGGERRLVILPTGRRAGHAFAMTAFSGALPPDAAGRWCKVVLSLGQAGPFWAKLEITDSARGQIVREAFFPHRRGRKTLLVHVPQAAGRFCLSLFMPHAAAAGEPKLSLQVLGRVAASLHLFVGGWRSLAGAVPGSPLGLVGRARAMLGQSAARRGQAPPYAAWIDLYDNWGEQERHALLATPDLAGIDIWVMADGSEAALAATLESVAAQWRQADAVSVLRTSGDWRRPHSDWVVILRAGERLAPQALACLARAVTQHPSVLALCADIDHYGPGGQRVSAGLRPPPDPWLMRTAMFADGAWMFHRTAMCADPATPPLQACDARLAMARRLPAARLARVPLILTFCPIDAPLSPAAMPAPAGNMWPRVSIIVPSACRSWHVLKCLRQIARFTAYADFEIVVAVSARDPADRRQARIVQRLGALPRVRLIDVAMPDFNFAAVINRAAQQSDGGLLLLLNDDVSPIAPDWLARLVAHTEGENRADIVGPRLLYGNGLVQHAGVIMGLANLCEHAFRLAGRADHGPQGVARLSRQVSAVTAACLLVRRALFESLGGLDEAFAIALNDVDFCLRAGNASVCVFAADVDMYHFESLSLGRHYQGARAGLEAAEVRRLRDAWAFRIMADPFYHPCASLELGREFRPGFPPRQTPLSWIGQEAPAPD